MNFLLYLIGHLCCSSKFNNNFSCRLINNNNNFYFSSFNEVIRSLIDSNWFSVASVLISRNILLEYVTNSERYLL